MPPYKFKYQGLQRAVPVGRHNETDFGGLGMGEQAEAAGAMRMVGGSADLIQGLVAQGISTGKSDRTIGRSIERATALMAGKSPGSNIRVNPRSFSQQAAAGGLRENWGTQLRESTNSFFKGDQKWWNKAMVSSGVAARQQSKQPWRFSEDPGLGYSVGGTGSSVGQAEQPGGYTDTLLFDRKSEFSLMGQPGDYADSLIASQAKEYSLLDRMGAGGDMFDQGRKSNLETWATMEAGRPSYRPEDPWLSME